MPIYHDKISNSTSSAECRIQTAVCEVLAETPRASSIVENLNSRLRNYFFLRRHIGEDYLDLLRFFLKCRRFQRSDRPERIGKSPAELLNGQPHPHRLELLGFQRFQLRPRIKSDFGTATPTSVGLNIYDPIQTKCQGICIVFCGVAPHQLSQKQEPNSKEGWVSHNRTIGAG